MHSFEDFTTLTINRVFDLDTGPLEIYARCHSESILVSDFYARIDQFELSPRHSNSIAQLKYFSHSTETGMIAPFEHYTRILILHLSAPLFAAKAT